MTKSEKKPVAKSELSAFLKEHLPQLPKVPDFIKENLPKFNPAAPSAGLTHIRKQPNLLEAYFKGDVSTIAQDAQHRPQHYTPQEHALILLLKSKKELPRGTGAREINELVLRYNEKTKPVPRPQVKGTVQHRDPTVQRAVDAAGRQQEAASFEVQNFPKSIRII